MSKREPIYKVIFLNQGQVFEMYAKQIYQSDLWGFLEVEEFVFGERTQVVVDPSEEKLKAQFDGVVRSFVPMHSIVRIDEVERMGTPKISEAKGQKVNVNLMDASGRQLLQRAFVPETHQHQEEFEVSQLSNGMYFLKVNTADKQTTLKVIKVE